MTQQVFVVSVMLINRNAFKDQAFNDGVITQRNTFQKYFTQTELKEFLSDILKAEAVSGCPMRTLYL